MLAKVLYEHPETRKLFRVLRNLGLKNMRPDVRHDRQPDGTYKASPDLEAWNADCRNGIFVCMLRRPDGTWDLNS